MSRIKEPNFFSRVVIGDDHPMVRPIRDESNISLSSLRRATRSIRAKRARTTSRIPKRRRSSSGCTRRERNREPEGSRRTTLFALSDDAQHPPDVQLRGGDRTRADRMPSAATRAGAGDRPLLGPCRALSDHLRSPVQVLIFEEWTADLPGTMQELLAFSVSSTTRAIQRAAAAAARRNPQSIRALSVRQPLDLACRRGAHPVPASKVLRNALLVKAARSRRWSALSRSLVHYYRDDVRRLESLLGRRLPWPNFSDAPPSRNTG